MIVLVDSDILIDVSRGRDREIVARWIELGQSDAIILYSAVSVAELWAGARPAEHDIINDLFRVLRCVAIDAEIGRQAGEYLKDYSKSHGLELGDALIAAIHRASLWTRNRKHYPMQELLFL